MRSAAFQQRAWAEKEIGRCMQFQKLSNNFAQSWDFKRKLTTPNWLCLGTTPWQRPSSQRPRAGCCTQKKAIGHCEFPSRAQVTPAASLSPNRFAKVMAHVSFGPMCQNNLFASGRQRPQAPSTMVLCAGKGVVFTPWASSEDLTKFAVCRPLFFFETNGQRKL